MGSSLEIITVINYTKSQCSIYFLFYYIFEEAARTTARVRGAMSAKYDIFISYRRDGGEYTAKILRDRLEELGYKVFFDVESLRSGDFNTKLYSVIDECKDFLLILSPNALDRCENQDDWVRCEVEHALQEKKNVIPIMLRGFSFPQTLPDSIEALRYKNGLEANTQFFDAFIDRLRQFLLSKPPLIGRLVQSTLFKQTLPVLIALLIVAAIGVGISFAVGAWNKTFPRTAQEKNVTSEIVYLTENHLQALNTMAGAVDSALSAAERYLVSGSVEETALQNTFELSFKTLETCDLNTSAPTDGLLRRLNELSGTPFPTAEVVAMHDELIRFQKDWVGNLTFIQWVVSPDASFLTATTRLNLLDIYRTLLENGLKEHAYQSNEFLLPITDQSALSEFFNDVLPLFTHIPLSAASWSTDKEALEADTNACLNRDAEMIRELASLVGVTAVQSEALRESLIQSYMMLGMSREDAVQYVESQLQFQLETAFQELLPAEGDDEDTLWEKLAQLVGDGYYAGALECAEALGQLVDQSDPGTQAYLSALRVFLTGIAPVAGIDHGVIVVDWADPDEPNEVYRIGDIIVLFNGVPCHTYEEYRAAKETLTGSEYTVHVIRLNESGVPKLVELDLDTGMPPVYLRTLSDYGYDDYE